MRFYFIFRINKVLTFGPGRCAYTAAACRSTTANADFLSIQNLWRVAGWLLLYCVAARYVSGHAMRHRNINSNLFSPGALCLFRLAWWKNRLCLHHHCALPLPIVYCVIVLSLPLCTVYTGVYRRQRHRSFYPFNI